MKVWNLKTRAVIRTPRRGYRLRLPPWRFHPDGTSRGRRGRGSASEGLGLDDRPRGLQGAPASLVGIIHYGRSMARPSAPTAGGWRRGMRGVVNLWDWSEPASSSAVSPDTRSERSKALAFSPDGRRLASGSWEWGRDDLGCGDRRASPHPVRTSPARQRRCRSARTAAACVSARGFSTKRLIVSATGR